MLAAVPTTTHTNWKNSGRPAARPPQKGTPIRVARADKAPTPTPLSSEELSEAGRLAERLHSEVTTLLSAAPREARSAAGLARFLGCERTACQRLLSALAPHALGPQSLAHIAGVKALAGLVDAARTRGLGESVIAPFEAAVRQLESFFARAGGSQRVFAERLLLTPREQPADAAAEAPPFDDPELDTRRRLYEAARDLIGGAGHAQLHLRIVGRAPGRPASVRFVSGGGLLGYRSRPRALPLVFRQGWGPHPEHDADPDRAAGLNSEALLLPFCSTPPPLVSTSMQGPELVHKVDAPAGGEPLDVLLAFNSELPASVIDADIRAGAYVQEAWGHINYPSEWVLMDVFHHREYAQQSIPGIDVHMWRLLAHTVPGRQRWDTKLPTGPRLELLGPGLTRAASPIYPRHQELLSHLFATNGWNPDDFIGYRCAVRYPAWRLGYRMSFDYGDEPARVDAP